jgi:hypothetical protein
MKRCNYCGGRFGLVTHWYFRKRFCRERCKQNYFAALAQKSDPKRRPWIALLSKTPLGLLSGVIRW